jgi:phosphosulfolactate synthase (CoM biosynthesis protein A)
VSEWGKTQLDSFYNEPSEVGPEVSEISSGISPRDMRPRLKSFDLDEATQVGWIFADMVGYPAAVCVTLTAGHNLGEKEHKQAGK